jgi:ribosomal protein S18 acetylase RimI-like enzyme
MEISYTHQLRGEDLNALRRSVGWHEISARQAENGVRNSAWIAAARYNGKTVACSRLISDGGYVAYIADVIVAPEFQGRGIGKTMIRMILEHIRESLEEGERVMVILMAAKNRESFYRPFGFADRPKEDSGAGMSMWIEK